MVSYRYHQRRGWIKKRKNDLAPVPTARQDTTGPANKKPSPCAAEAGFIEDLMKVKGIGGRIDLHVEYNFKLGLGSLSIFFGLETQKTVAKRVRNWLEKKKLIGFSI